MSQITCSGSGPASSATTSPVPSGCSAIIVSTRRRARSRTEASVRATTFGVNALLTMLRRRRCRGSSITIIEPKYSDTSGFASLMVMLGLELKICGCRLAKWTSSYRVTAQWPAPPVSAASRAVGGTRPAPRAAGWRTRRRAGRRRAPRTSSRRGRCPHSGTSGGAVPFTRVAMPTPLKSSSGPASRHRISETCSNSAMPA